MTPAFQFCGLHISKLDGGNVLPDQRLPLEMYKIISQTNCCFDRWVESTAHRIISLMRGILWLSMICTPNGYWPSLLNQPFIPFRDMYDTALSTPERREIKYVRITCKLSLAPNTLHPDLQRIAPCQRHHHGSVRIKNRPCISSVVLPSPSSIYLWFCFYFHHFNHLFRLWNLIYCKQPTTLAHKGGCHDEPAAFQGWQKGIRHHSNNIG